MHKEREEWEGQEKAASSVTCAVRTGTGKKIPMGFGIFGDHVLNISVSGYRKRITVELEPDRTEPIWWEEVGIEYCPFCGTNLNALKREE